MTDNMCLLEKLIQQLGFKLIHDGQNNPEQIKLKPREVKCFTRKYRLQIDGIWQHTWIIFKYDTRQKFLNVPVWDFEVYSKEPHTKGREKLAPLTRHLAKFHTKH